MLEINSRCSPERVAHQVILDLLPGFQRFHGSAETSSTQGEAPIYSDHPLPGHRSWLGYFQPGTGDQQSRYVDRIDSRNQLGTLVATRALVTSANAEGGIAPTVEPTAPGLANAYMVIVGRNASDGFILRMPDTERSLVEEIHTITVHRFQEELSAQRESPATSTVAWMNDLLTKLGVRFTTFGKPSPGGQ